MKMKKKRSSGYVKVLSYLKQELKKPGIQGDIKRLRKELDIPPDGFKPSQEAMIDFDYIPQEWGGPAKKGDKITERRLYRLSKAAHQLLWKLGKSQFPYLPAPTADFLFYGRIGTFEADSVKEGIKSSIDVFMPNMCTYLDAKAERARYKAASKEDRVMLDEATDKIDEEFPISIRVSAYASIRDTIDYIQHAWSFIEGYQGRYKKKDHSLGKTRTRNSYLVERDDFIYGFKGPRPEMRKAFLIRFPGKDLPDAGAIGAIRHKERKRRRLL